MIEAVDTGLGHEGLQSLGIGMVGPDLEAVAALRFRPEGVGFWKQPASVEGGELDIQPCLGDQVGDRLVLKAEAGGEDDAAGNVPAPMLL